MVIRDVNDLYVPGASTFLFFFFSFFFSRAAGSLLAVNASVYISFVALGELPKCTAAQIIKKERERVAGPYRAISLRACVHSVLFLIYLYIHTESTHTHPHTNTFKLLIPSCYTGHYIALDCVSRAGIFEKCKGAL